MTWSRQWSRSRQIDPSLCDGFIFRNQNRCASKQHLFDPSRSWKQAFYQAVRDAARALGVQISGVHRLRANCFQNTYEELMEEGWNDKEARQKISKDAGHNRAEVTYSYVPKRGS